METTIKNQSSIKENDSDDFITIDGERFRKFKNYERDRSNPPPLRFWEKITCVKKVEGGTFRQITCSDGRVIEYIEPDVQPHCP